MKRKVIWGIGAFLTGALAGALYLRGEAERMRGGAERRVVQLVRTLERQSVLEGDDLKVSEIPERYADPRTISPEEAKKLVGKRVRSDLPAGAILGREDVEDFRGLTSVEKHLEPGYRAFLLRAEQTLGGEEVRATDRVDVALVPRERSEKSELLLENVEVISGVSGEEDSKASRSKGVPLAIAVRLEDALKLVAAEARGKFRILPRNFADHAVGLAAPEGSRIRTYQGVIDETR